jgi:mono/diheme cytochrome c family protein
VAAVLHRLIILLLIPSLAIANDKVTYDDHVLPIFEQTCLNCHNPDKAKGGLDLSSFPGTMKGGSGGKVVEPGDLSSKLLAVVRQTSEPIMPPEGERLSSPQIKVLEAWVAGGLLENASSKARKAAAPKFDTTIRNIDPGLAADPPPLPRDLSLEPVVIVPRGTAIHAMALSPTAPLLAITGQNQILLYHTQWLELLGVIPFSEGEPTSLSFTPNGRYLIVGGGVAGKSGITVSFDVVTGERMLMAAKEFDTVLDADLHPDLSLVATGSPSKLIKLWKTADGSQTHSIKKHTDWVTCVDFSGDGILLATGDRNGGLWVWESATGIEFHTLRGHQAAISEAQFRADSNLLASASEDGSVRFWEMNGGTEVKKIDAHPGGVLAFSWGRDGSFATAGRDKTVKLWKPDFNPVTTITGLQDIPTAIALDTPTGRVFIADYRGHIAVHETGKGTRVGELASNPPTIASRLEGLEKRAIEISEELALATTSHQKQVDIIRKHEGQLATNLKSLEETRAQESRARDALTKAGQAVETSKQRLAGLGNEVAQAKTTLTNQETVLRQHEDAMVESRDSVIGFEARLQQIDASMKAIEQEEASEKKTAAIQTLRAEADTLTKQLAISRQQLADGSVEAGRLAEAVKQARDHLDRLVNQSDQEEQTRASAQQSAAQQQHAIEQASQRIQQLEKQIPAEESAIKKAREALAAPAKQLHECLTRSRIHSHQIRRWKRAEVGARIHTARSLIQNKEEETESLISRFEEATQETGNLQIELAKKRGLLQQIEASKAGDSGQPEIADLASREAATRATLAELTKRLDSTAGDIARRRQELDAAFLEIHRLRFQLEADEARYAASSGTSE